MMSYLLGPFQNFETDCQRYEKFKALVLRLNPVHLDSIHPLEVAEDMILYLWYLSDPKQDHFKKHYSIIFWSISGQAAFILLHLEYKKLNKIKMLEHQ